MRVARDAAILQCIDRQWEQIPLEVEFLNDTLETERRFNLFTLRSKLPGARNSESPS